MARFWGKAGPPWIEKHGSASDTRRRGPGQDTDQRVSGHGTPVAFSSEVVRMRKTRQNKKPKPGSDSIRTAL